MIKESDIQKEIVSHLSTLAQDNNFFFFSIPNEGFMSAAMMFGIDKETIAKMNMHYKKLGQVPGMPDLCVLWNEYIENAEFPNHYKQKTLFIEVKRPGEDLRDTQKYVHEAIKRVGHDVEVAFSLDDVLKLFREYGVCDEI